MPDDPRAEIMRALGEERAAELLTALGKLLPSTPVQAEAAPASQPRPTAPSPAATREQGRALLRALHRDTEGRWRDAAGEEPAA